MDSRERIRTKKESCDRRRGLSEAAITPTSCLFFGLASLASYFLVVVTEGLVWLFLGCPCCCCSWSLCRCFLVLASHHQTKNSSSVRHVFPCFAFFPICPLRDVLDFVIRQNTSLFPNASNDGFDHSDRIISFTNPVTGNFRIQNRKTQRCAILIVRWRAVLKFTYAAIHFPGGEGTKSKNSVSRASLGFRSCSATSASPRSL